MALAGSVCFHVQVRSAAERSGAAVPFVLGIESLERAQDGVVAVLAGAEAGACEGKQRATPLVYTLRIRNHVHSHSHPSRPAPPFPPRHQRDSERTSGISLVVMTRSMTLSNLSSLMKLFAPPDPSLSPRICSTSPSTCRGGRRTRARAVYTAGPARLKARKGSGSFSSWWVRGVAGRAPASRWG